MVAEIETAEVSETETPSAEPAKIVCGFCQSECTDGRQIISVPETGASICSRCAAQTIEMMMRNDAKNILAQTRDKVAKWLAGEKHVANPIVKEMKERWWEIVNG